MRPKALKKESGMSDERLEFLSRLPLWTGLSYELLKQVAAELLFRFSYPFSASRLGSSGGRIHEGISSFPRSERA